MSEPAEDPRGGPLSNLFYRRPRLLILTLALVAVWGLSAYQLLPRAEDPTLSKRVARVITLLPGATPERVESLVSEKLEEELAEIPEIKLLRSESRVGISILVIELADAVPVAAIPELWAQVRAKLDDAEVELPRAASDPEFEEMDIEAFTLISALTWNDPSRPVDNTLLRRLAQGLQDSLRAVSGTADVDLHGVAPEEVRVEVDPVRLTALGIAPADVARALLAGDAKVAAGTLSGVENELLLEVGGELDSLARIRRLPIRQGANAQVVRLEDIARVERTVADPMPELALIDGTPGVSVSARMSPGNRVDQWSAKARAAAFAYAEGLPTSVRHELIFDQDRYTSERLDSLSMNLFVGALLVVGVLLVLMGWRSALLVGAALPLASLMVLGGMRALEIPMHQMSVTGLIIALGLLIDNAIVMVDEVRERLAHAGPAEAVSASVSHLAVPLLGSTLTTVLAFMPIVLLPGPAGEFVGSIAVSVILALISSLFLALTVLPAVAAFFGIGRDATDEARWWQHGISSASLTAGYRKALDVVLTRPLVGIALPVLIPLFGFWGGSTLQEQFFPPADRDQFQIELRLPVQTPLDKTREAAELARSLILEHPEVAGVHWFIGRAGPKFYYNQMPGKDGSPFYAQALVQLRSPEGAREVLRATQRELDAALPAAQVVVKPFEQGPPFDAPVELHLLGPDLRRLRELGDRARGILAAVPHVTHTRSTIVEGQPKVFVDVDEEAAQQAGLTNVELALQLQQGLQGALGGSFLDGDEELPVRVRIAEGRQSTNAIESLGFKAPPSPATGFRSSIPLTALGDLQLRPQLASITHRDGERSNTIQGFLVAGILPAQVLGDYQAALEAAEFSLPPGYRMQFGGEAQQRDEAVGNLMASVGLLLVLMAGTLVLSFNSFRQAAIIGVVGFLSAGLSLAALYVFGHPFGFTAIVGTMGLIGVAINDAIVVLAAIREDPQASQGDPAAIREVVVRSTRHVVATTVTTVAGFVPLLLAGSEFWSPLATAIAGGVSGATLLALCFVPASFLLLSRLGMRCPLRNAENAPEPAQTEPPRALAVAAP